MKSTLSLCGEAGGVWKLSKWVPVGPWLSLLEKLPILQ